MRKVLKNILIFGATSDIVFSTIKKLVDNKVNVYAVSRSNLELDSPYLHKYNDNLSDENSINELFLKFKNIFFDRVIIAHGACICAPVENLNSNLLDYQINVTVKSLLSILKNLKGLLNKTSRIIFLSSMASYGLFPFLSLYSISKASSDIILNSYEIETGIKTVSLKIGVVATKFWASSVDLNKKCLSFNNEYSKYADFMFNNALKNSTRGLKPSFVSDFIYKLLYINNPKTSYTLGFDAHIASIFSLFKSTLLFKVIRFILDKRVESFYHAK